MKHGLCTLLCVIIFSSADFINTEGPKPFAVVELFTSEGCSSCPPADDLLKEVTGIFRTEGKEVIGLAFHVTYWNKIGWEDPYSQEIFTERQKKYAQRINAEQLYTPQAIVNGEKEFVGSNRIAFREAVLAATSITPAIEVGASARIEKDNVVVEYKSNKTQSHAVLNVALVETDVKHYIPRGENKNLTLHHFNIVRSFATIPLKTNDTVVLPCLKGLTPSNSSIILYAQNSETMKIIGATQVDIK
jgi:hypothetical protein